MPKTLLISALLSAFLFAEEAQSASFFSKETKEEKTNFCPHNKSMDACPHHMQKPKKELSSEAYEKIRINVTGQGVAPTMTSSPAQAYALAKRAAIADAYRLMAEKIKGVRVEGSDKIKNMMVMRSEVRTFVDAIIAEAQIVETVFKDGLCEIEMELLIDPKQWKSILASR